MAVLLGLDGDVPRSALTCNVFHDHRAGSVRECDELISEYADDNALIITHS
jgi:hypothetical protein